MELEVSKYSGLLKKHIGEWVIICDDKVIAHDKDLCRLKQDITNCKRTPLITKVPKENTLIF